MPTFEVVVMRRVTERADIEIDAESEEEAREMVVADITTQTADADWRMCDCQDDGWIWSVKEKT